MSSSIGYSSKNPNMGPAFGPVVSEIAFRLLIVGFVCLAFA
jgi:hypothetical protein